MRPETPVEIVGAAVSPRAESGAIVKLGVDASVHVETDNRLPRGAVFNLAVEDVVDEPRFDRSALVAGARRRERDPPPSADILDNNVSEVKTGATPRLSGPTWITLAAALTDSTRVPVPVL